MQVKQFAKTMAVTPDTVRFYTREGLLAPAKNRTNGYHSFSYKEKVRLRFIMAARGLGFSVKDIHRILDVADTGTTPCPMVRELIELRLDEVEERYQEMARLRDRMQTAVKEWKSKPDREPTGDTICHLIESIEV